MSHWAELDENNIVIRVLVGDNNEADEGYQWLVDNLGGTWVQTSYNATTNGFRKNYAGIGYTWDGIGFASPQPYASWTLDADTYLWQAPTLMPTDDKMYSWNEENLAWEEIAALG